MADTTCQICQQPVTNAEDTNWEILGNNNKFGWAWQTMMPRGVKLARVIHGTEPPDVQEVPKFLHVETVRELYHFMHSRCFTAQRKAFRDATQITSTQ